MARWSRGRRAVDANPTAASWLACSLRHSWDRDERGDGDREQASARELNMDGQRIHGAEGNDVLLGRSLLFATDEGAGLLAGSGGRKAERSTPPPAAAFLPFAPACFCSAPGAALTDSSATTPWLDPHPARAVPRRAAATTSGRLEREVIGGSVEAPEVLGDVGDLRAVARVAVDRRPVVTCPRRARSRS